MFAVVFVRKGHLKVTKESGISLVNKLLWRRRRRIRSLKRQKWKPKPLQGNVYGSLTLDIRKAGDYSQPLPVAVRVCHAGQKVFLRLGKTYTMEEWLTLCEYEKNGRRTYTMEEWLTLCEYEKSGRRVQLTERNDMKNLMDRVELITNQLIAENNFSLRKLQDRFQGRKDDDSTIITVWDSYIQSKTNEGKAGSARCVGFIHSI